MKNRVHQGLAGSKQKPCSIETVQLETVQLEDQLYWWTFCSWTYCKMTICKETINMADFLHTDFLRANHHFPPILIVIKMVRPKVGRLAHYKKIGNYWNFFPSFLAKLQRILKVLMRLNYPSKQCHTDRPPLYFTTLTMASKGV